MPYIITTRMAAEPPNQDVAVRAAVLTRTAVATPDDARRAIIAIGEDHDTWIGGDALHGPIDRNGGTIGPLPDGTVIEVRPVMHVELAREAGLGRRDTPMMSDAAILAAFNAS